MKNTLIKICSVFLCVVVLFSAVACKRGDENVDNNGGTVAMQDKIFTDGVHVYKYTETDKYVVKNSQSEYKVVISSSPSSLEKMAQEELCLFFEEATGVTLPVVYDNAISYNENNKVICLGQNNYYKAALSYSNDLSTSGKNLEHDGYMIETVGNSIYIFGDFAEGALFGVYRYLAIEFNYDCYSNNAYHIDTNVQNVTLKDFSVIDVPDYIFRSCQYSHIVNAYPTEYRMGFDHGESFAINSNSAHTSFIYLPKETYQKEHPDWYSVDNTQLCYYARGNQAEYEAMINEMFEIMKESFKTDDGYFFRIGHADSVSWCNCETCSKNKNKYGADSASVIIFANKLVEKMEAWLKTDEGKPYARDYRVTVLAYGLSLTPPTKYNESAGVWEPTSNDVICHERVMPWFAPLEMDYNYTILEPENKVYYNNFLGWKALCNEMSFYLYSTNYKYYLVPTAFFEQIQGMYQLGAAAGGYYIHDLGQRQQASGCTAWHVLKAYLISKLSWDVNLDVGQLTKQFFEGYFGVASETMLKFYESYRVHAEYTVNHVYSAGLSVYMPLLDARYWPKDILDQWLGYVNQALSEIEYLKRVDQTTYQNYYDRITLERISLYFMMIKLYENVYGNDFVQEMKLAFKEDCNRLGVTVTGEGSNLSIGSILKDWGV